MVSISVKLNSICLPSEDVIAREIGDEMLIVPLVAGIVDADDALYTLNPTAHMIWNYLDGKKTLQEIIDILSRNHDASYEEIKEDVLGFVNEMIDHSIINIVNA
jgi:hypothetical protein